MIRQATVKDVDDLIEMGKRFLNYSAFSGLTEVEDDDLARGLCSILDNGIIFVAEKDGKIVGGICGMMSKFWFAPRTQVAAELAWWVDEKHRGSMSSIGLLKAFEKWAKQNGAQVVSMSDLKVGDDYPVAPLFDRLGYSVAERSHVKGV
jgi:GNAT superfamily N-acetyltransferase